MKNIILKIKAEFNKFNLIEAFLTGYILGFITLGSIVIIIVLVELSKY